MATTEAGTSIRPRRASPSPCRRLTWCGAWWPWYLVQDGTSPAFTASPQRPPEGPLSLTDSSSPSTSTSRSPALHAGAPRAPQPSTQRDRPAAESLRVPLTPLAALDFHRRAPRLHSAEFPHALNRHSAAERTTVRPLPTAPRSRTASSGSPETPFVLLLRSQAHGAAQSNVGTKRTRRS